MAKIYTVIAEAIKNNTLKNQFSTVDVVDKDGLIYSLLDYFMKTDTLFNPDNFQEACGMEVSEDDETKVIPVKETEKVTASFFRTIITDGLRKAAEMQTDVLAHKLDIDFESALFIQDNFRAILKEGK